ncbi:MAG: hypothetical protein GY847_41730 [Proteobacteria bacterium]|nr:hypothetical protein [Pseudomonadota bacterium]
MKQWPKELALLGAVLVIAFVMSCAEEREPINRVQPNVIKKAMLDGEWYFHQKVVDVPGGTLQGAYYPALVGWYADPERIRFEIQEDFLYVRRIRELVEGAETYNRDYDRDFSSNVVLATFKIDSHFDIQRDYNPTTGESMNVVLENSKDRPWHEREYIRVDWKKNLTAGFSGYTWMLTMAPSNPTPFYVQTECTPEKEFAQNPEDRCVPDDKAPFFDIVWNAEGTALEQGYFDITTQYTASPGTVYFEGYGELPACWMYYHDFDECSSAQYFLRNSFWKYTPEDRDFEAMEFSGHASSQMGFFYNDVMQYDEQEMVKESSRKYFLNRFSLWEQSHSFEKSNENECTDDNCFCKTTAECCTRYDYYYDEYRNDIVSKPDFNNDTAQDAAAKMAEAMCNSTCDTLMELRPDDRASYEEQNQCQFHVTESDLVKKCEPVHYCTLPYNQRRVRPIVYYANKEWPEELNHHPDDPRPDLDSENATNWDEELVTGSDEASITAWRYAYADQPDETRSANEQISDRWSANFTRVINILKTKAAGKHVEPNVPYLDDDMKRRDPETNSDFTAIGTVDKANGVPMGNRGFDEYWYDSERPPFVICRFAPVLGPNRDQDGREPDICWERIQELSHCVFDPARPGVNPKTGEAWFEASEWPICSAREASPRLGDVRHSMTFWVDKWYQGYALLGLGPPNPDFLTGEILSGSAHLYVHNDMAARRIVDATMLITGDLDTKDYIDGYNLEGWRNRYTGASTNPENNGYALGQIGGMGGMISHNRSLSQKLDGSGLPMSRNSEATDSSTTPNQLYDLDQLMKKAAAEYSSKPIFDDGAMLRSIADHPKGASIEADLFNAANSTTVLAANGYNPQSDRTNEELLNKVLVTRNNPFKLADARQKFRDMLTVEMKADFADTAAETASISLAYEIQRLRKDVLNSDSKEELRNFVWRLARKKLMHAVTTHELGHSLGLRHNFGGSQDFMNYKEDYWKVRTSKCADVAFDSMAPDVTDYSSEPSWPEDGECDNPNPQVGPRYLRYEPDKPWSGDPLSKYEVYNKIHHKAYSSIMDYAGTYHIDEDGLGRYDWAAMLFGYGHHFEVFKNIPGTSEDELGWEWQMHDTLVPGIATADSPDGATIIDEGNNFDDVGTGTLVVNLSTGEESTVATKEVSSGLGGKGGTLTLSTPFAAPMKKGDKYAVWGPPMQYSDLSMRKFNLTGLPMKDVLKYYQTDYANLSLAFNSYFWAPHYTEWPKNWGTEDEPSLEFNTQSNRDIMDIRMFDWRVSSQGGESYAPGFFLVNQSEADVVRVPYVYCTDNRADIASDCRRRDYGADDWERMNNILTDWNYWYISRSFIRRQIGVNPNDYMNNYYGRYYRVPKQFNDLFVLYVEMMSSIYHERVTTAMYVDPWNSWGGTTMAVHDGFNMLMQTLAAPDVGPYTQYGSEYRIQDGDWAIVNEPYTEKLGGNAANAAFDIAQGARIFETEYSNFSGDESCGVDFSRCLWNIGWYYDKIMAIYGLSESETYFVARDTASDLRQFRISFFDNFNWQIKKYFSAMMGEEWNVWAPVTVTTINEQSRNSSTVHYNLEYDDMILPITDQDVRQPRMFFRDWANPAGDITQPAVYRRVLKDLPGGENAIALLENDNSTNWTSIDPNFGFTTQVYAMVLGMARFQDNFDISFYNSSRMWTTAGDEPVTEEDYPDEDVSEPDLDGGIEDDAGSDSISDKTVNIVSYYDPENAMVYKAVETYRPSNVMHPWETHETKALGVAAAMIKMANRIKSRGNDCDPTIGPDAYSTKTTADDCCDDPYAEGYPLTPDVGDDCPMEYGDTYHFYFMCDDTGSDNIRTDDMTSCAASDAVRTDPCWTTCVEDESGARDNQGRTIKWALDENGDNIPKPIVWDEARSKVETRKQQADDYLKRYRSILDFQVRLTKVYDEYVGFL